MYRKKITSIVITSIAGLLLVFSIAGCSFMGLTIEPPSIHLKSEAKVETTVPAETSPAVPSADTSATAQEKPQLAEGKISEQEILANFDEAISKVAESVKPSVVNVKVQLTQQDAFGNLREGEGVGSGIIYSSDGYIITNNHVAADANAMTVTLNDGSEYTAKLIGADANTDIAVIKIEATGLKPAEFTAVSNVKVGQLAIAVGSPFGFQESVTVGVISAVGRDVAISYGSLPLIDLIQTDAAINPGNSGGALVNSAGQVLGVNTMIYSTTGSSSGIGFAIPSDTALDIADKLINSGDIKTPYLGIEMAENTTDINGVYIKTVIEGYPAQKAGIKPGDIITAVGDKTIETPLELVAQILRYNVGDSVTITLNRNGETIEANVVFVEKPENLNG